LEEDRDQAPELILVEQGAVGADKSRTCRPMFAASSGLMVIARPSVARRRRSTTASCA